MHSVSHSIMFHHFHGLNHHKGQGSIDSDTFSKMLSWLSGRYNLLSCDEYLDKSFSNSLSKKDICLSFDDALLCQYDIALPVLSKFGIKAFFFVYSSPMKGEPDLMEVYRYFRNVYFHSIDDFYDGFFNLCDSIYVDDYLNQLDLFNKLDYLNDFQFYSHNDKWFRFLRDKVLGKESYEKLMREFMNLKSFDFDSAVNNLWLTNENLSQLSKEGHILGLHSYSHPMVMKELSIDQQISEYSKNLDHLSSLVNDKLIISMSHPCGSYNDVTLGILKKMGIKIGFRSNMAISNINSLLEIPREDHSNVLKEMNLCV